MELQFNCRILKRRIHGIDGCVHPLALGAMPKAVACFLVNSPAAVGHILPTTTLWGIYFHHLYFATCLW